MPSSPGVSEDTQIANENNTLPKNETANFLSGENKLVDSVVENTYDGNDAAVVSDIKPLSIEYPKENDVVIATSKSSNPEPRQAAEDSLTPIFEQRLAAQFDATEMDKSASEFCRKSSMISLPAVRTSGSVWVTREVPR